MGVAEGRPRKTRSTGPVLRVPLLLILVGLLVALLLLLPLERIQGWGWDFAVFRAGSKSILAGDNPYVPESIQLHADSAQLATIPFFVYAPHFGLLLSPLALLPPVLASRLWFIANLVFAIASIALLASVFHWKPSLVAFSLTFVVMALHPALRTLLGIGQSAGLLVFLLSLALYFQSQGKPVAAGICLGLGLFKPHLVLILPFLAWRREWRMLLVSLVTFASANLMFIHLLDDWWQSMLAARTANLSFGCLPFVSLPALVECLPHTAGVRVFGFAAIGLVAILGIVLLVPASTPGSERHALQVALVMALTLLLLDNVRVADTVLLLPAVVAVCAMGPRIETPSIRNAVVFLLALGVIFPLVTDVMGTFELMWKMPVFHSIGMLATAASLLLVAAADRIRGPATRPPISRAA